MSRRGGDNSLVVIYWRSIPAQVTAGGRGSGHKALLDARFQDTIDRAAIVADKTDYNSYIEEWRRAERECGDDLESEVKAEADRLEAEYTKERLEQLVLSGGVSGS